MKKNDVFCTEIRDISDEGAGIGDCEGMTFFIPGALPGDIIEAGVTKLKKSYGYARLIRIIKPSSDRIEPRCDIAGKCGGCPLMSLSYEAELKLKERKVRDVLMRIGGFGDAELAGIDAPIVGMEEPYRYRNKAQYPVRRAADGSIAIGFFAPHSHRVVPCEDCIIGQETDREIISKVREYMEKYGVEPYDEETGRGELRHILIRTGRGSSAALLSDTKNCNEAKTSAYAKVMPVAAAGEGLYEAKPASEECRGNGAVPAKAYDSRQVMVCLVVNGSSLSHSDKLIEILSELSYVTSVMLNENTRRDNVILGRRSYCIYGKPYIEDHIGGVGFRIQARSFYQVNPKQTERLYGIVADYAALTGREYVWDIYCGIGTIGLTLARGAREVYGIEIIPEAIEDARENARINNITTARFETGAAEEVLAGVGSVHTDPVIENPSSGEIYVSRQTSTPKPAPPDVVIVDPPRKGCDIRCLSAIIDAAPSRIIYVSCNPSTLARDLRILCDGRYILEAYQPVDQFGRGVHVETVVLLTKQNI